MSEPRLPPPDNDKLRELILYVCHRSEGDAKFGATKLNKLLFYADFLAYRQLGRAITHHLYKRLKNGPAPRAMVPTIEALKRSGDVAIAEHNYYGRKQIRTLALRDADLGKFTADEIALVDSIIHECWGKNATEMSIMSHRFLGWKLAEDGETIPYETALITFESPTDADRAQADHLGNELQALSRESTRDVF